MSEQNTPLHDNFTILVQQHIKEIEKEIEQEFINILKKNIINPYEINVIFGNKFVFVYVGARRYKRVIRFKFLVFRRNDRRSENNEGVYKRIIGKLYVNVRIEED